MATELFGTVNGFRAYQEDQMKLSELASQNAARDASIALSQAQIANYAADNARADAEAKRKVDEAKASAALQAKLAELAKGDEGGEGGAAGAKPVLAGGSRFDSLLQAGERQIRYLINTGRVDEAMKMMPGLTGGVKDLDQARQAASAARENEIDAMIKKHDFSSRALSGVRDQATYDMARMQLASSGLFSEEDFKEMPARYNPRFVAQAIAGSGAAKQKADIEREASRTASLNAGTEDEIKNRKLTRELEEKKHKLAKAREDRLEKQGEARLRAGGDKPLPPASMRELEVVRGDLKRQGLKVGEAQADLISDVAEQVKTLVDSNPGLSRSEATARVVEEMKARGEISDTMFGGSRYKPKEGSVTMPLPTPKTAAELKKGFYYLDAEDGLVKLFDGKGFKVSTRRRRTDVAEEE